MNSIYKNRPGQRQIILWPLVLKASPFLKDSVLSKFKENVLSFFPFLRKYPARLLQPDCKFFVSNGARPHSSYVDLYKVERKGVSGHEPLWSFRYWKRSFEVFVFINWLILIEIIILWFWHQELHWAKYYCHRYAASDYPCEFCVWSLSVHHCRGSQLISTLIPILIWRRDFDFHTKNHA